MLDIFSMSTIEFALGAIWRRLEGFRVIDHGDNIYQFFFERETDVIKIERGSPWLFRNYMIHLRCWHESSVITDEDFSKVPIWIQFLGSPEHYKTLELGRKIGTTIGEVLEVDFFNMKGCDGRIVKARTTMDVSKTLRSKLNLLGPDGKKIEVHFKYETPISLLSGFSKLSMREVNLSEPTLQANRFRAPTPTNQNDLQACNQEQRRRSVDANSEFSSDNEIISCTLDDSPIESKARVVKPLNLEEKENHIPLQDITNSDLTFNHGSTRMKEIQPKVYRSKIKSLACRRGQEIQQVIETKRDPTSTLLSVIPKKVCLEGLSDIDEEVEGASPTLAPTPQ
ncbi:hypothetical protein PIB30_046262 [Stylosanthes scabra]|uniref:DUF4283 domain-containing protein n=1 Tax=Stylosanthes scabra TaxID=79078 RepID=A0ABU6XHR4_9FABA|nr:hypothetical protein [Stylosanthes scabra]